MNTLELFDSFHLTDDADCAVLADALEEAGYQEMAKSLRPRSFRAGRDYRAQIVALRSRLPGGACVAVPIAGGLLTPDAWKQPQFLNRCLTGIAKFSLYSTTTCVDLPVNVVVTGRVLRRHRSNWCVRVRIEFVGDGEPSTFSGGWLIP